MATSTTKNAARGSKRRPPHLRIKRILRWAAFSALAFYGTLALSLVALRWINPPLTAVHVQRRIESWFQKSEYRKRYTFIPMNRISRDFQHAVIAAEDTRFFEHHGFDWKEVQAAVEDEMDGGRWRGASTITQQLAKNLFFTTARSPVRKVLEYAATPLVEAILSKQRILEVYLNVVEWGPGVYGAEAAARYHYKTSASRIGREQGARLAALLPSPRRRRAARMNEYSARILERMSKMGW